MKENLIKLHNTLALVETKGESTKIMAQCLAYVEQLIKEEQNKPVGEEVPVTE